MLGQGKSGRLRRWWLAVTAAAGAAVVLGMGSSGEVQVSERLVAADSWISVTANQTAVQRFSQSSSGRVSIRVPMALGGASGDLPNACMTLLAEGSKRLRQWEITSASMVGNGGLLTGPVWMSTGNYAIELTLAQGRRLIRGWAVDPTSTIGSGVDGIAVWLDGPVKVGHFIGVASYGQERMDVARHFGTPHFAYSGWTLLWDARGLRAGAHELFVYAHRISTGSWSSFTQRVILPPPSTCDAEQPVRLGAIATGPSSIGHETAPGNVLLQIDSPSGDKPELRLAFGRHSQAAPPLQVNGKPLSGTLDLQLVRSVALSTYLIRYPKMITVARRPASMTALLVCQGGLLTSWLVSLVLAMLIAWSPGRRSVPKETR